MYLKRTRWIDKHKHADGHSGSRRAQLDREEDTGIIYLKKQNKTIIWIRFNGQECCCDEKPRPAAAAF